MIAEKLEFNYGGMNAAAPFGGFENALPIHLTTRNNGLAGRGSGQTAQFAWGTAQTLDTLQSLRIANNLTLIDYGLDLAWSQYQIIMQAYNDLVADMLTGLALADITTDRQRAFGSVNTMVFEDGDQFSQFRPQKVGAGPTSGAPLRRVGAGLLWTYDYWQQATPQELAAQIDAIMQADTARIYKEIRKAIYQTATNYTFTDDLIDGVSLFVKAFINNDSNWTLPVGQNGTTFATSHQHYSGTAVAWSGATGAQRQADAVALINNAREHLYGSDSDQVRIYINYADEALWTGMTDFKAIPYQQVIPSVNTDRMVGARSSIPIFNVLIGQLKGCEIWVKPWAVANFAVAHAVGQNFTPALWVRVPQTPKSPTIGTERLSSLGGFSLGGGDLRLVQSMPGFPLIAQAVERRFGIGVNNRAALALLDQVNASYTAPTIS